MRSSTREQRLLGFVAQDRDDEPVDQPRAALNQVQVAIGDRIERARINGDVPAASQISFLE